ncbi:MAG TPA: ATP-binding protein [Terriglobia bacterium]|nr:ATP-binding protein [Terriglobia bacterium]
MIPRSINLSLKLTVCLIGSMVIVFIILGYQTVHLHKRHLEDMTMASAERISETIKRSTHYYMLTNHRDAVYETITTIGAQPTISKIRIFNKEGRISFSTDKSEVNSFVDKKAEACYACHAQEQPLVKLNRPDRIRIYSRPNGERIIGLINPVENEPSCYAADCHAHPENQRVLGVLDVTMSLAKVDEMKAQGQRRMVASFVVGILISMGIVGLFVWFLVHRPIKELIAGTQLVAAGNLDHKIKVSSHDQLGELAESFNRMTDELKRAYAEIRSWAKTLEARVEQKTAELKRAHEHMIQVERMASIGKLAAIVAHEINNPLAGILTYAKLLLKKIRNNGAPTAEAVTASQYLEMIASESARCGEIVKNLLQFSRQTSIDLQPHDINEIVLQSLKLVQHKIHLMNLEVRTQFEEHIPPLVCDSQLLKQALLALFINACEAMTQDGGTIEIISSYLPERKAVEIRVHDNGVGMDEETRKHIFEPFFTTKEQGKGVGLGLAVVYGIINQHSGEIEVESARGQGSTVTIRLPQTGGLN